VVRGRALAHHAPESASGGGSGLDPADLLTIQQVADRLAVGRTWVRRRLESGDLTGIRQHPSAPTMVSARQLAEYLERFPGILPSGERPPSRKPEGSEQAPAARARKGAA
jgi:hypothetical protein